MSVKKLVGTIARKLGSNKGAPRVWLEGILPERAGFKAGARYNVHVSEGEARVVLRLDNDGIRLVSAKTKADRTLPVIDINSKELLARFEGMDAVRVVLMEGELHILPDAVEVKKRERKQRLETAIEDGLITVASVSHGMGVLSNALHQGFEDAGLKAKLLWACEIDEEYIGQAAYANNAWDNDTIAVAMPMQKLAFADDYTLKHLQSPVVLEGGLPCTAASPAGRSKKHLARAEDDEEAGHLVAAFIAIIARVNPSAVLLENVKAYMNTSGYAILRTQLKELGYVVHERDVEGEDYAIEARPRRVMVAVTEGVDLDLSRMVAPRREPQTIGMILESVPEDDPSWSEMAYLDAKEERDKAAGKGFRQQIVGPDDTSVGVCGRGYGKRRATEPRLRHPSNPKLKRLFTPIEHARLKGVPEEMLKGVNSHTRAHELLGQSVIWPAFRHLGEFLGRSLTGTLNNVAQPIVSTAVEWVQPAQSVVSSAKQKAVGPSTGSLFETLPLFEAA